MNCEELTQLIPDIVDGSLSDSLMAEVEATLPLCPDCQQEIELARQVRAVLQALQAENAHLTIPRGFEARLLARIHQQRNGLELLDLSSKVFGEWLVELINLIGGLLDPRETGHPQTDRG
jgi:hypothetical protein